MITFKTMSSCKNIAVFAGAKLHRNQNGGVATIYVQAHKQMYEEC